MRRRVSFRTALAALCAIALLALARHAEAGQGFVLQMPIPPKPPVAGLSLVFDCTWVTSPGYLPVRLTVQCTPPSPVERTLSVELNNRWDAEKQPVSVTTEVVVRAGTSSLTKVIAFPRHSQSYQFTFHVWEDGVHLDDLSFENMGAYYGSGQQSTPALLFVADAAPDVSSFDFMGDANVYQGAQPTYTQHGTTVYPAPATGRQPATTIAQVPTFVTLPASLVFEDWIDYSSLDVIIISLEDVENLVKSRPRAWQALRRWTQAGGNLCIFGAGADWKGLPAIEERLGCPANEKDAASPERGWNAPRGEDYYAQWEYSGSSVIAVQAEDPAEAAKRAQQGLLPPTKSPFLTKPVGLGMVAAIASDNPFPGDRLEWRWLFTAIGPVRWNWETRHGISVQNGTSDFDNFLISDVGLPPVKSYRVLITLFVIAIGPVNYWLLRRRGRLHWLLFTVPAAAIVISLALVAYAVVADGFQTYLRARSFTRLDQARDEAVSWARLSYYAGMAPSSGLTLDRDTAIFPMERDAVWYRRVPTRHVSWTQKQELPRGWLASRTPTQYTTVRPYTCQRELRVFESADPAGCAVENRLDTRVSRLMLRDSNGNLYTHSDLAPGGKAVLKPIVADTDVQMAIVEMLSARNRGALSHPEVPAATAATLFFGGRHTYRSNYYSGYSGPGASMLEECLDGAFGDVGSKLSKPRTYVAVVSRPPDVPIGLERVVESQSLHVIYGNW